MNSIQSIFTSPIFVRISDEDVLFLTKHLATMIKAGIPLSEALGVLGEQARSASLKQVLSQVQADVLNGRAFSQSLERHPRVFNQFYSQLIAASEKSGTLEKNLEFLAIQLNKALTLKKKIQGALMYPGLIFVVTFGMGGYISLFILPQLVSFFEAFQTELPLSTKVLLAFAILMKNYGFLILGGFVSFLVVLLWLVNTPQLKLYWHTFLLKVPLFGKLLAYTQLARFSRNLGLLLASGVPIVSSLETTINTLSNVLFRYHLTQAVATLSKGKQIGVSLVEQHSKEFPPLVTRMISIGEKTGKLDETLLYLADFYEEEIDNISKNLSTLLEPFLLVTIGLIVGFVAIAIISPIYELTGSLRR